MSHCFFIGVVIEMRFEETFRQAAGRVEKLRDAFGAELELIARSCAEDLDAIAGRDDQSFTDDVTVDELAQACGARFIVEGESFADLYRSSFVIDSDEKNGHFFTQESFHAKTQRYAKPAGLLCALCVSLRLCVKNLFENMIPPEERRADKSKQD